MCAGRDRQGRARVSQVVERRRGGVAVRPDGDYRKLAPEILTALRAALPDREQMLANKRFIRPGWYTDRDLAKLPRSQWSSFIAEHERLKELGLEDITPMRSERENYIAVLPISTAVVRGFDEELLERVNAKADVLGQVGDFQPHLQRHLAVFVHRWDVSGDPESMAVPGLPDTIDILWVVNRWSHEHDRPEIWVARRWSSSWGVHTL